MHSTFAVIPGTRNPAPPVGALAAMGGGHWLDCLAPSGTIMRFRRNEEIVEQGEATEYCYQIVSGCVRTAMVMEDGRRQIGEFLFAGDLLGYEAVGHQPFAVSAVTDVTLRRFRRAGIEAHAGRDAVFDRHLRQCMAAQLRSARNRLALLGRGTAGERIMSFLREMHTRLAERGSATFDLPMKLTDVGDYLGLAPETVCRGMADLRRAGAIATDGPRVTLRVPARGSYALH